MEAFGIILIIVIVGFVFRKPIRRFARKQYIRRVSTDYINQECQNVRNTEILGLGNIGLVLSAEVAQDYARDLGLKWESYLKWTGQVVIKLCVFKQPKGRLEALTCLADRMEKAIRNTSPPPAICPFLGVGRIGGDDNRPVIITEIMPVIEGENLDSVLRKKKLEPAKSLPQLIRVLETVPFLESLGFYSRSLDAENVMVSPDGQWTRIDFDNAVECEEYPLEVMYRMSRFTRFVFKKMAWQKRTPEIKSLMRKLKRTEKAPLYKISTEPEQNDSIFLSVEVLIQDLQSLSVNL